MNNGAWLNGQPTATGLIKQFPDDFRVIENLGFTPEGEGEHVLLKIRKKGCNTQFVADNLAKFANIPRHSVSYAGLKDRHAITEQWFCLHLPGQTTPDLSQFILEGCQIIETSRHRKKLRLGMLSSNAFCLRLRECSVPEEVEKRLTFIKQHGVPNYFGEQRFGHNNNNLQQAYRWAKGEISVRERTKRSFYLSAVRSALFNYLVHLRLQKNIFNQVLLGDALQLRGRGSWFVAQQSELTEVQQRVNRGELHITAVLPGCDDYGTQQLALQFEQMNLSIYQVLLTLLQQEKVASSRRAILLYPENMQWHWHNDHVELSFLLPAGAFATSVVREIIQLRTQDIVTMS